eukprot:TRINITY_DN30052_c0_g1_i1.p1 TRINITY_DN30052_c0_g1~~TRINITY_DN30052_c0_g1_i1.p1  ORF type:complete len:357 (+),score=60.94 TRINITY_DN30052_c0_g1_i1:241-1311(+)
MTLLSLGPAQNITLDTVFRGLGGHSESTFCQVSCLQTSPSRLSVKLQPSSISSRLAHPSDLPSHLGSFTRRARARHATRAAVTCEMVSISERFAELKAKKEVAIIPFIVAGDPDLATTEEALLALDASGADIIELGCPYSDPLADGPVIQAAATRALANGTNLDSVLQLLARVSPKISAPVVLFTYYNPIMSRGPENFFRQIKEAGASGLVIPDIPLEETPPIREMASAHGLELVLLTTPTTPVGRMAEIAEATQGFLYLVSLTGVTGARAAVESRVERLLGEIRKATTKPVAVGFGISTKEHATQVAGWGADGVIVGSKMVTLLHEASSPAEGVAAVASLVRSLKEAVTKQPSLP